MPKIWDCKDSKKSANSKAFCKIFQLFSTRNFSANCAFIRNLRTPPQIISQLFRHRRICRVNRCRSLRPEAVRFGLSLVPDARLRSACSTADSSLLRKRNGRQTDAVVRGTATLRGLAYSSTRIRPNRTASGLRDRTLGTATIPSQALFVVFGPLSFCDRTLGPPTIPSRGVFSLLPPFSPQRQDARTFHNPVADWRERQSRLQRGDYQQHTG